MVYAARPGRIGVSDLIYGKSDSAWRAVIDGALHLNFGDFQYRQGAQRFARVAGADRGGPVDGDRAPAGAGVVRSVALGEAVAAAGGRAGVRRAERGADRRVGGDGDGDVDVATGATGSAAVTATGAGPRRGRSLG